MYKPTSPGLSGAWVYFYLIGLNYWQIAFIFAE